MKFGLMVMGQRPQFNVQYADEEKVNPINVQRTDSEVYHDILRSAELAEALGFDSYWITEHAFSEHGIFSSPHSMMAAIAARTSRIKIGIAVTIVPHHSPLRMAQDLATVDVISEGRLIWGVGRGYQKHEFDGYGVDMSESRDRLVEGMDIAVKAWTEERFAYAGKFNSYPEVMITPKPVQKPHPPIMLAVTHSPESVDLAVKNRWGLLTVAQADPDLIKLYHGKMLELGVPEEDISVAAARVLYMADNDDQALKFLRPRRQWSGDLGEFLRKPLAAAGRLRGYEHYVNDPFTNPEAMAKREPESESCIGSPEKVTKSIKQLESQHVSHFLGYLDSGGLSYDEFEGTIRMFAEKVMPNFR